MISCYIASHHIIPNNTISYRVIAYRIMQCKLRLPSFVFSFSKIIHISLLHSFNNFPTFINRLFPSFVNDNLTAGIQCKFLMATAATRNDSTICSDTKPKSDVIARWKLVHRHAQSHPAKLSIHANATGSRDPRELDEPVVPGRKLSAFSH